MLRAAKIKYQELSSPQMRKRWPQINFEGIEWGIFEPECGYLDARGSCQRSSKPSSQPEESTGRPQSLQTNLKSGRLRGLEFSDGSNIKADIYVFACGPWLGKLFPRTRLAI